MCINYLVQQNRNNRDVWPTLGTGSLPHPPRPNETLLYPQCSCSPILCQHCARSGPGPRDTATAAQCRNLMVTCRARSPNGPFHPVKIAAVVLPHTGGGSLRFTVSRPSRNVGPRPTLRVAGRICWEGGGRLPSPACSDNGSLGGGVRYGGVSLEEGVSAGDFSTFIGHILKFLYLCFFIYLKNDYFPRAAQGKSGKCNRVDRQKDSKKASFRIWVEKQCSRDTKNHIVFLELACF